MKFFFRPVVILVAILAAGCFFGTKSYRVPEGVDDLATQLVTGAPKDKKLTLVVADFSNFQGDTDDLGRYVSERLATRLSQQGERFRIVERRRLLLILSELNIGMSGLVDASTAKKVGKMLGANSLVLGTVTDMGDKVEINARIIEVESGNSLPGAVVSVKKDRVAKSLFGRSRVMSPGNPEAKKVVFVYNKGPHDVRISEVGGAKKKPLVIAVHAGRIHRFFYSGFPGGQLRAWVYDNSGRQIFETPVESFSNGTWVWIFDAAGVKRTQDTSVLPQPIP